MVEKCRLDISTPRSTNVSLDKETAQDLYEFFGELCRDGDYVEPALLEIGPEVEVPEISERLYRTH